MKQRHLYRFGPFLLEPEERILLRDGQRVNLPGGDKAFDLLVLLAKNSRSLVRRDRIVREVWPDTHVGEENLINVHISHIRKTLGEDYVETVAKHGYRFTANVTESFDEIPPDAPPSSQRRFGVVFVVLPVIVVLIGSYLWLRLRPRVPPERGGPAVALYQRALKYERVGDDEQALTTLDQAIALDPSYQAACVRAAYVAYELEEDQRAAAYLARCQAVEAPDEALRLKAQALSKVLAGSSTGAMELYQLLIDRYPLDAEAQFRFAELATDLDRVEEADRAVQACLAIESENPYCRFQSMYVKLKKNRFDDVLSDYQSLPAGVRDYPWFDAPVAVAFLGKGQLDDATRTFDLLSKRQQQLHGTSHFTAGKEGIAEVLLYKGQVNDATRRIQQLMETGDNASIRGDYLAYLAQIYALLGDGRQAAKFAKEAATLPAESGSLTKAALVLATLGDSEGMERILKVRAGSAHANLSLSSEHLIRGALAVAKGNTAAGIEEIRLAYDFNPRDEEAAYQLGMAYVRAGDYRAALQMFRAVSDLKGTVLVDNVPLLLPLTTYRIAECYDRLGDANAAKPFYAEVAKLWASADDDLRPRDSTPRFKLK